VIDYTNDVETTVRSGWPAGVDAALHLAGDAQQLARLVRPGGRFASTLGVGADQLETPDLTATAVMAMPSAGVLDLLAADVAAGKLLVPIQHTYQLEDVPQAIVDFARGTLGKLAIAIVA
jgi:NADPH:quinone reductase-like Zn-dependent oxidoreductase